MYDDLDLTAVLACDDVPVKGIGTGTPFVEMHVENRGPRLNRKQWKRLSRRTRHLLESGRARITTIHELVPLRFPSD